MFVRPSLHGKKGPVKFKLLFARYSTLNGGVKNTVELNWMTFEVGNGWNEVKIGHKGMEMEAVDRIDGIDEDWRVFDRDKERNERQ